MPQSDHGPSFEVIEAALRSATEYLARQPAVPATAAPDWNDTEWRIAKAVVAIQGMAVQLAATARWRGPDHWESFLREQRRQTLLRHDLIRERLADLHAGAKAAGLPLVALKGAALYRTGIYDAGERPMGDIDLLARPGDMPTAKCLLVDLGYVEMFESSRHVVFEPRGAGGHVGYGEHVANPIKVELHSQIAEALPVEKVDITRQVFPVRVESGLNHYPSYAALMLHLLLHAAGNIRARALRQIQLHDIASLAPKLGAHGWAELEAAAGPRGPWWALPPLALTMRYYPGVIPDEVLATTRRGCPRLLARAARGHRLSDVSWSRFRIQAFPGIEWATTPLEAARFAMSRLWPTPEALGQLRLTDQTQSWSKGIPWYGKSHLTRIVGWLVSRPPRVLTLYSVRAALADR
jgi:hypothetical protein